MRGEQDIRANIGGGRRGELYIGTDVGDRRGELYICTDVGEVGGEN